MYEREEYRMNYVCVSINKEVVNKETFSDKQQAMAYFQTLHGERILEEKEGVKHRLENHIVTYEKQIQREWKRRLAVEEQAAREEKEISLSFYDCWQANLDLLCEKKKKKEVQLEQIRLDMEKIEVDYEAKYNGYKENLYTREPQLMLHISGIYQNGQQFTVIEEKYYYIGAKIDTDKTIYTVLERLPQQFDKNRYFLYVFKEMEDTEECVEQDNLNRIQNTVNRIRNQILRNFQNGLTRCKMS